MQLTSDSLVDNFETKFGIGRILLDVLLAWIFLWIYHTRVEAEVSLKSLKFSVCLKAKVTVRIVLNSINHEQIKVFSILFQGLHNRLTKQLCLDHQELFSMKKN